MTIEHARLRAQALKDNGQPNSVTKTDLEHVLLKTAEVPINLFKPAAIGWRHVTPGQAPYIEQTELYKEVLREGFEIAEDDEAGIMVEVQSDFLLSGVNFMLLNVQTGQILED